MAFTIVTVTGSYKNTDGSPASGSVEFRATAEMENGGQIRPATLAHADLVAGALSVTLPAVDDSGTSPVGVVYTVTEYITGAPARSWLLAVPHTSATLDLSTVAPALPATPSFGYALDSQVAHLALTETFTGVKHSTASFDAAGLSAVAGQIPAAGVLVGRPAQALGGNRVAVTGDSITLRNSDPPNSSQGDCWLTYMIGFSNATLEYIWNGGHGGYTSTQLLAVFASEILARDPSVVGIMCGTNDVLDGSNTASVTAANIKAMVALAQSAGVAVFLCTIPPQGTAALGTPAPPTLTQQATGGTLGAGTYAYRITTTNQVPGETLASSEVTIVVASGTTNQVTITVPWRNGMTGFNVYGRTTGAELKIATVTISGQAYMPNLVWVDTGSVTPSGALPGSDTTAVAYNATFQLKTLTINSWIRRYVAFNRIWLVDMYAALVDPLTGLYQTGFTIDGTHPTLASSRVMGQAAWNALSPYFPAQTGMLASDNADPLNLVTNGLFATGSASLPTGWSSFAGFGTNFVDTRGALSGFLGNALSCQLTAPDTQRFHQSPTFSTGFSVGDRLAVTLRFKQTGSEAGGGQTNLDVKNQASSRRADWLIEGADFAGVLYAEWTVLAGDTGYFFTFNVEFGTFTASIGQLTIYNLTAQNIVTP